MPIRKKDLIKITVDSNLYPLEAIYGASYAFLDKAYIRLSGDPKGKIIVQIKGKGGDNPKKLENLADDFTNELINYGLRSQISKNNKKIREYIVGTALLSALGEMSESEGEAKEDWQKDALGIAVPWEDKYGGK